MPGKFHGWKSLVGCSPWGRQELDTTERLHFDFLLSCIGEGNGNPLQCSCLENPRDGGAWWAAICGVAQSRTRLKRLSSSSSIPFRGCHAPTRPSIKLQRKLHMARGSGRTFHVLPGGGSSEKQQLQQLQQLLVNVQVATWNLRGERVP